MNRTKLTAALVVAATIVPVAAIGSIRTGGSTGALLIAQKLANAYKASKHITVTVTGGGSGAGINGAYNGNFQIGNSSRAPKSSDHAGLTFTPFDREPFVVIVNPANKVSSLTQSQIAGIFTGSITNWKTVGGANLPIKVFTRVATSGTLATFRSLYLGGAAVTSAAPQLSSNGLDRSSVANNRGGISFVTYQYVVGASSVKPLKVGGVAATLANVINGRFSYWGYQYFVTKGDPTGAVKTYIDWVHSSAGQAVIRRYAIPANGSVGTVRT